MNGEYLVVTVNGKTYTSQTGGAVVVDPDHNTGIYRSRTAMP